MKRQIKCHSEPFACHSERSEESRFSTPHSPLATLDSFTYIHTYIHKLTPFLLFLFTVALLSTGYLFTSSVQAQVTSITVIPYLDAGYKFKVVSFGEGSGFEQPGFDDSDFSDGDAGFGTPAGGCLLNNPNDVKTTWPLNTDILLRKEFIIPSGATNLIVGVAIDNDVQVFINGHDISGGLQIHEGCANRYSFIFIPPNEVLIAGINLLAVRGRDRGGLSYIDVQVNVDIVNEDCANGIDDDEDGLVDCDDPECCGDAACFTNPVCPIKTETLLSRQAVMSNVEVTAPDFAGTSTLNFTGLEFVKITTGSFAEKGFSKGACEATLEGAVYTGEWKGVAFLKPLERKIYLKGAVTGQINATVEGYLTESVLNSENYDKYQATWKIGRLGGTDASATINANGTVSYQNNTEYPNTELYLLQANIETTPSGDYDPDPLNVVLTHLRVVREDSPYFGEGFSIISYNSVSGSGQGWTYDRLLFPGVVEMKGLFSSPLFGIASATLDDSTIPRTLSLRIERIDLGIPPMADLEVRTWGPQRVSPGQTVDYMVEYRNDGVVSAEDAVIVLELPSLAQYLSSTNEGIYRWETHEAFWKLGTVIPGQKGVLSVKVYFPWGLAQGIPQPILAKYCTSSTEKDYYLNPDREPLCDSQDYLDYQPLEITSENILTPEEFAEELASDARLNDLYQYAIESGYSRLDAIKLTLNEGSFLVEVPMVNPSSSEKVIFLTNINRLSVIRRYTETGISLFDRGGGVLLDFATSSFESWGEWAIPGSPTFAECLRNCIIETIPNYIAGKTIKLVGNILAGANCVTCSQNPDPISTPCMKCARALSELKKKIPGLGEGIHIQDIIRKCLANPSACSCTEDKVWCSDGEGFWAWLGFGKSVVMTKRCVDGHYLIGPAEELICSISDMDECGRRLRDICVNGKCVPPESHCGHHSVCNAAHSVICPARDPNIKYGPSGAVEAGQKLDYKVEFENEGEGIAFGVYFTDTLDEDLDDSTLVIGPVIQIIDGVVGPEIGPPGAYNPATRTITWFVGGEGEIGPNVGGYADFSVNVRSDAPRGTEIINYGTVYFPSVPEETRTNAIVSIIPANEISCNDGVDNDGDGLIDCDDPECFGQDCPEVCDDEQDNDGDGWVDCADTDCPPCLEICDNGLDDDGDGLIDCDDPDCRIDKNYIKGAIKFGKKGDTAQLVIDVGSEFCGALPGVVTVKLSGCDPINILVARKGKSATFLGKTANASLKINCKKHTLTLRLKGIALKDCVENPVKTCISVDGGSCICAEAVFTQKVKKGVPRGLIYP